MGDVVNVSFGQPPKDGGKARILARRKACGLRKPDDLAMDHADPEDTRPSELA
jgi:hypothetical protein